MALYNREKILYLAKANRTFNVDIDERADTTISEIITEFVKTGKMIHVGSDDASNYYQITLDGERDLLKMQIAWRKKKGKDYLHLVDELALINGEKSQS